MWSDCCGGFVGEGLTGEEFKYDIGSGPHALGLGGEIRGAGFRGEGFIRRVGICATHCNTLQQMTLT